MESYNDSQPSGRSKFSAKEWQREADKTFRILVMLLELSGPYRGWGLFIGHPWKKFFEVKMEHMLSLFSQIS